MQRVAGSDRLGKLHRTEAARADAAGLEDALVEPQPQRGRHGVQARGDEPAELPRLGELDVDVKRLRVPLPREIEDGRFGDRHAAAFEAVANLEILEVAIAQSASSMYAVSASGLA